MTDLTGNVRYRKAWTGRLIVEAEYRYTYSASAYNENDEVEMTAWKEASAEELTRAIPGAAIV